jgi:predicted GH43/DUF377 family glycosyl hydrolase
MEEIINELRTPNKSGRFVVSPSYKKGEFDSHAVDCPFLFYYKDRYWMTFVGFDGVGYRTGLASSFDLETWKRERLMIDRGPKGSITEYNAALTNILRDNELYGPGTLKTVDGRFVGSYHAYPNAGYEAGPAVIGLCYSTDLRTWDMQPPILRPSPNCEWESGGLYKSWILEHEGTYYLFYNARNTEGRPWIEQTGFATSNDLINWERCEHNPALKTGPKGCFDDLFASDPCVLRHKDMWVMYYFGNSTDKHARDGLAVSTDLINWRKIDEILIDVGPEGSIDSKYAHKPGIITKDGKLYHFYCAVYTAEDPHLGEIEHPQVRGISYATS